MNLIDTHHHILPKDYFDILSKIGIVSAMEAVAGVSCPKWNEHEMITAMDKFQIKTAMTSIPSGVYFGDINLAIKLARMCNEFSANLIYRYPKRIGAFATLPLPDIKGSLKEINYALDELKLDGIFLLSNYGEHYLGHPNFEPIFEELNKRKSVVFIHPTLPVGYLKRPKIPLSIMKLIPTSIIKYGINRQKKKQPLNYLPVSMIEFVCDTTRTIADLIFSGRFHQFPNIKFILSHAGGTLPYIAGRMAIFEEAISPELKEKAPDGAVNYLKRIYYDTALSTSPSALKCLIDFVPQNQILFGSDYPYVPLAGVNIEVNEFDQYLKSFKELHTKISYENAQVLFPRLKNTC